MTKREINAADYAGDIIKALRKGILLTTKNGETVDSMVIGWGTMGINWGRPVFTAYVRTGRFTASQLTANPEFTINVPVGEYDKNIIKVCGSKSGRNVDKVKEAGLTLVDGEKVSVPAVKEFPLTLECRVIYRQDQEIALYSDELMPAYPQDVDSTNPMANKDPHSIVFGEIVAAYIMED